MGNKIIIYEKPYAVSVTISRKLNRSKPITDFIGIYNISFEEFKKQFKNTYPNDSIQTYKQCSFKIQFKNCVYNDPIVLKQIRREKIKRILNK